MTDYPYKVSLLQIIWRLGCSTKILKYSLIKLRTQTVLVRINGFVTPQAVQAQDVN